MKQSEVPQDKGHLNSLKEVYYAIDEKGDFSQTLSTGWDAKNIVQTETFKILEERTEIALQKVQNGEVSPIVYFMEKNKMDLSILSSYVSMWKWRVKRHFKPAVFTKLNDRVLKKYADVFEISVEELKSFKG